MEEEGVKLNLGNDVPQDMASFDSAYLSPTYPQIHQYGIRWGKVV